MLACTGVFFREGVFLGSGVPRSTWGRRHRWAPGGVRDQLQPLWSGSQGAHVLPGLVSLSRLVCCWASKSLQLKTSALPSDLLASRAADLGVLHLAGCLIPAGARWAGRTSHMTARSRGPGSQNGSGHAQTGCPVGWQ